MTQDSTISKKQLSKLKKNQDRLETFFGGVKHLKKCPDYMIILNQPNELIAVKESNTLKIPNITVLDTNCNPDLATFKIPGNDDSIRSLYFLLRTMLQAFFMPAP
jgi:small subunit ribosomal protein S2